MNQGDFRVPAFRQKIFETARGLRASLGSSGGSQAQKLRQVERLLEKRTQELEEARRLLANKKREGERPWAEPQGGELGGVNPGNIVWIFGSGRTGSTWLMRMMQDLENHTSWREPLVGELFGRHYYNWVGVKHFQSKHFILGSKCKESWLRSVRNFVMDEAEARFPQATNNGYLVIREPNGSIGAPLLVEALPESRMILLIRDPRDVVASSLDATRKGSWLYKRRVEEGEGRPEMFDVQEDTFVERAATTYWENVSKAKEAYEAHGGPKVLVRYEELRPNTLSTMKGIYSTLGITVDEEELKRVVDKHAWENIPEKEKGKGQFHRKATPGGWREDLTPEQVETVERVTAPLLREFYSEIV
jgi:hypothetical protein